MYIFFFTHIYDNSPTASGYNWTGDLIFHPRMGMPIEIECELYYSLNDTSDYAMFGIGLNTSKDQYSSGWSRSVWLTDYPDRSYGHGQSYSASGVPQFVRMSRTLNGPAGGNVTNPGNWQWGVRGYDTPHPWTVGVWGKCGIGSATLTVHQFLLRATYYA